MFAAAATTATSSSTSWLTFRFFKGGGSGYVDGGPPLDVRPTIVGGLNGLIVSSTFEFKNVVLDEEMKWRRRG